MKMRGEFPTRLKSLRGSAMMSQDELAMKIGVSVDSIRRWESGTRDPRLANVYAIAEALGVSVVDLLCEDGEHPAEHRSSPKSPEPTAHPEQLVYEWERRRGPDGAPSLAADSGDLRHDRAEARGADGGEGVGGRNVRRRG